MIQPKTVKQIVDYIAQESGIELTVQTALDDWEKCVNDITLDSREVRNADLFIAIQGEVRHGLDFLESVLGKQPGLVIADQPLNNEQLALAKQADVTVVVVKEIKTILGNFASWIYEQPSSKIKVVGITGTNGKTSSAFFTGQLLQALGQKVALMGTLGNGPMDNLQATANTTPDSVTVHRLLNDFVQQGIQWVVMEVSSHALCLGRIQGVTFQTVALTQVTRDHMDFHGTIEHYQASKARLFYEYPTHNRVLNASDLVSQKICHDLQAQAETSWCYQPAPQTDGSQRLQSRLSIEQLELNNTGIHCQLVMSGESSQQQAQVNIPLMGRFNIENVCCALSILLVNDFSWSDVVPHLASLRSVAGRMQLLQQNPTIILDFAHTPDALQQVLLAIKAHQQGSQGILKVVFGCGGNRDKGKRPMMGQVAEQIADQVIITSDNPRDEQPQQIIDDILAGLVKPQEVLVEADRSIAIEKTLNSANQHDIILIAGKGHEDYQEINGVKYPYSDAQVVTDWNAVNE